MPPITALLHTKNDGLRLGRALETLLPCSEILIVDHQSSDQTTRVARRYGARVVPADDRAAGDYSASARYDWILCLDPSESLTEALQATLFEWSFASTAEASGTSAFSFFVREQVGELWRVREIPETRLIPRNWGVWNGHFPAHEPSARTLEGELLRLAFP
jgi:glycosyltransferase involved in cell wall biosynthesis